MNLLLVPGTLLRTSCGSELSTVLSRLKIYIDNFVPVSLIFGRPQRRQGGGQSRNLCQARHPQALGVCLGREERKAVSGLRNGSFDLKSSLGGALRVLVFLGPWHLRRPD